MQTKINGSQVNILLNDLADVDLPTPSVDDVVKWNGSAWVNSPDLSGGAISRPAEQIVYGTGSGLTSASTLLAAPSTGKFWINTSDGTLFPNVNSTSDVIIASTNNSDGYGAAQVRLFGNNSQVSSIDVLAGGSATSNTFTGGALLLRAGSSSAADGGPASLIAGSSAAALGGTAIVRGGSSSGTLPAGNAIIRGGQALGSGQAGSASVEGGQGSSTADGGSATIQGGSAAGSFIGGTAFVRGGASPTSPGGVSLEGGAATTGNGGFIDIYAGEGGSAGNGGDVAIVAGSTAAGGNSGGNIFISAGLNSSLPASGGFVDIKTNDTSRLVIDAEGAWRVDGAEGTSGYVLTSGGVGATPTWQPPVTSRAQTFIFSTTDTWVFDGNVNNVWSITTPHSAPVPPIAVGDETFTNQLRFLETGTYKLTLACKLSIAGETLILPDDLTTFGLDVSTSAGQVLEGVSSHTVYTATTGGNSRTSFASAPIGSPARESAFQITWTDAFVVRVPANARLLINAYAYNSLNDIAEYVVKVTAFIEKISDTVA